MNSAAALGREILEGKTIQHRLEACREAGNRNQKELIPILTFLLREKDARLKIAAIKALGRITHEDAVEPISRLLIDKDDSVRDAVVHAIIAHGQRAVPLLLNLLQKGGRLTRISAATCLANLKEKQAIPLIIQQLGHCDHSTVIVMSQVLTQFGEDGLASLFPGLYLKKSECIKKAKALLSAGDFRFVTPLVRYLKMCRHSPYHYQIHEVMIDLEFSATTIGKEMYCMEHFRRFRKRKFVSNFYPFQYSPYLSCRQCKSALAGKRIETVVASLNREAPAIQWRNEKILLINWFKRTELFDFDRIEIHDATDQEIIQFCVTIGNDTDRFRRKRYKTMQCLVLDRMNVNENSRRVLDRTFGQVHVG